MEPSQLSFQDLKIEENGDCTSDYVSVHGDVERKKQIGLCRGSVSIQRGGMAGEMGGKFKREGTHAYLWLIHAEVQHKATKFCKAIILQLKNKF